MKKVYFVRHGESEGNVGEISNTASTPLTEKGRKQASFVAERCAKLPIEVVISSTMVRSKETADIITGHIHKPIEYSDLFGEIKLPSEVHGKPRSDQSVASVRMKVMEMFHHPGFRHSDEESFDDLKSRARMAMEHLVSRPENHILVVTHSIFMRILLAYLVMGESLTALECRQFMRTMITENTCISIFGYNPSFDWKPWTLHAWNDHAHLG